MAEPTGDEAGPGPAPGLGPGPDGQGRSPVERAVHACVLTPLVGVASAAGQRLPGLVTRGRSQVQVAKMVGRFAVEKGVAVAGGALSQAQRQAADLLQGARPGDPAPDVPDDGAPTDGVAEPPAEPEPAEAPADGGQGGGAAPDPGGLAIPDYDSLSASQVVPRLDSLGPEELEAVRAYEAATRARKTILAKVAQLQAS